MRQLQRARAEIRVNTLVGGNVNDITTVQLQRHPTYKNSYWCNWDDKQSILCRKQAEEVKTWVEFLEWDGETPAHNLYTYNIGGLIIKMPYPTKTL